MLQAEIVYKEGGSQILIEGNMVTGHLASFVNPVGSFGSERKMLLVVSLHYSVIIFVPISKFLFAFFEKELTHWIFPAKNCLISHISQLPYMCNDKMKMEPELFFQGFSLFPCSSLNPN